MNRIRGRDPVAILSAQARPDQTELQQYITTSSERLNTWLNIYHLTRRRSKKSSRLQNTADHSSSYKSRIYIYIYETRLRQTRDILCKHNRTDENNYDLSDGQYSTLTGFLLDRRRNATLFSRALPPGKNTHKGQTLTAQASGVKKDERVSGLRMFRFLFLRLISPGMPARAGLLDPPVACVCGFTTLPVPPFSLPVSVDSPPCLPACLTHPSRCLCLWIHHPACPTRLVACVCEFTTPPVPSVSLPVSVDSPSRLPHSAR